MLELSKGQPSPVPVVPGLWWQRGPCTDLPVAMEIQITTSSTSQPGDAPVANMKPNALFHAVTGSHPPATTQLRPAEKEPPGRRENNEALY